MRRTGFFFRALLTLILFGLLAAGGYAVYQAGLSQGYAAGVLSEGGEGVQDLYPPGAYGMMPYRGFYGFGHSPFFFGIGLFFKLLFFFLLFGLVLRLLFFRRTWGWNRHGRPYDRKEWKEHWEKHAAKHWGDWGDWGPRGRRGPWMERDDEPEEAPIKDKSPGEENTTDI